MVTLLGHMEPIYKKVEEADQQEVSRIAKTQKETNKEFFQKSKNSKETYKKYKNPRLSD